MESKELFARLIQWKAKFQLHHIVHGEIEREYVEKDFPEMLDLAKGFSLSQGTADHQGVKYYGDLFDEKKQKAEEALRAAGVDSKRQKLLEDLVYFSDIKHSIGFYSGSLTGIDLYLYNWKNIVLRPQKS